MKVYRVSYALRDLNDVPAVWFSSLNRAKKYAKEQSQRDSVFDVQVEQFEVKQDVPGILSALNSFAGKIHID